MKPETRRAILGALLALSGAAGLFMTERGDWAMFAVILIGALMVDPKAIMDGIKVVSTAWRRKDSA